MWKGTVALLREVVSSPPLPSHGRRRRRLLPCHGRYPSIFYWDRKGQECLVQCWLPPLARGLQQVGSLQPMLAVQDLSSLVHLWCPFPLPFQILISQYSMYKVCITAAKKNPVITWIRMHIYSHVVKVRAA